MTYPSPTRSPGAGSHDGFTRCRWWRTAVRSGAHPRRPKKRQRKTAAVPHTMERILGSSQFMGAKNKCTSTKACQRILQKGTYGYKKGRIGLQSNRTRTLSQATSTLDSWKVIPIVPESWSPPASPIPIKATEIATPFLQTLLRSWPYTMHKYHEFVPG